MKTLKYFLIALLFPAVVLTSCKDDGDGGDDAQPAFEILKDHLLAEDMDLNHIIKTADGVKFVTAAPDTDAEVAAWADAFTILDIRDADAFANGHIPGAKNIAFADILTEAAAAEKKMLIVCFTGQTACFATSLLRLAGYDAQALKWGMSGWNADFDSWTGNIGDIADGHANWSYEATAPSLFSDPVITSTSTDGATILMNQIEAVIAEGFGANAVKGADVLDNPSSYFINNYYSETDYAGFGHISSATRILPLMLEDGSYLNLDPDGKVVTYCYTGQTSAVITAYLNVIGYDAVSLKFGMNGLNNSNGFWSSSANAVNQWSVSSNPKDLSYEVTK